MPPAYDLDFAKWTNEDLAEAAQESGLDWPVQKLLDRHQDWMDRQIATQAQRRHCQAADVEDSIQNSFPALLEAIHGFPHPDFAGNGAIFFAISWPWFCTSAA